MKLLNLKKITEGKYLKKYELTYLNKRNKEKVYELISRNELKSVHGEFKDNSSDNESIKPKFYSREEVLKLLEEEEFASRTQLICDMFVNGF